MSAEAPRLGRAAVKRLITLLAFTVIWGAVLFGAAGRVDWARGWIYLGLYVLCLAGSAAVALRKNPEVIIARGTRHKDAKTFDKLLMAIYTLLVFASALVPGLDAVRFRWSSMPIGALWAGAVLYVLGVVPITWAMAVNPYLETTVRVQRERGHKTITAGPYRFVRHPMYVGIILQSVSMPLVLGSAWAFVPAGLVCLLFIVRTALEDRTLLNELPGYREFAAHTRYRLLPGIW